MNAVSGAILIVLLLVVTLAPRRWALLATMAGVFFLTEGHSLNLAGLNLYPVRFLSAVAFARVLLRRELIWSQLNRIDLTLLLLYNYTALVWILRSSNVAAHQFASALDPTLCYLALRAFIGCLDDLQWFLNGFVVLLIPFTALVFLERLTGHSSFAIVGAADALPLRNGVPRCPGSFGHAILLGSVAAAFFSLYIGLWLGGKHRTIALLGTLLCLSLVALSNSGGPLVSALAAFLGWLVWPLREKMHLVRRAVLALLLFLLLFMEAPIWYLPFKISAVAGGSGYHRSLLMERAWQHLGNWWLVGMDISQTADWIPYMHPLLGGADITNQFIAFGLHAGLASIGLSAMLLVFAFTHLGRARGAIHRSGDIGRGGECLLWGVGVTLFVHAVSWLGVSYFDQSWAVWLMHLAAVPKSAQRLRSPSSKQTTLVTPDTQRLETPVANVSVWT